MAVLIVFGADCSAVLPLDMIKKVIFQPDCGLFVCLFAGPNSKDCIDHHVTPGGVQTYREDHKVVAFVKKKVFKLKISKSKKKLNFLN
jgi:hypothetical protein